MICLLSRKDQFDFTNLSELAVGNTYSNVYIHSGKLLHTHCQNVFDSDHLHHNFDALYSEIIFVISKYYHKNEQSTVRRG